MKINWKLNNLVMKNEGLKEETIEIVNNFIKENGHNEMTFQNLWDASTAICRGKFIF